MANKSNNKANLAASLAAGALSLLACDLANPEVLKQSRESAVRDATFEVVIRKHDEAEDPLTYERELPFHLLPFSVRSDTHVPVGTAFAIGRNEYVTAAHVFIYTLAGPLGPPLLRDRHGKLYEIENVLKFSMHEDMAVFTVRGSAPGRILKANTEPRQNTPVFAVGNAHGEGIVIRDGLYTSDTPEELDGSWKWLRFSAGISPGSSGGPLLDSDGRVIGLIIGTSAGGDLGYALPIKTVLAASRTARFKGRGMFGLPNFNETMSTQTDEQFDLPSSYEDFTAQLIALMNRQDDARRAQFHKTHEQKLFPLGERAAELLQTGRVSDMHPYVIGVAEDDYWSALDPSGVTNLEIPNDGDVSIGRFSRTSVLQLWNPTNVTVTTLLTDSRRYMDLALLGLKLTRTVGADVVRISSLGEAASELQHVDRWGRPWQVRTWQVPFADSVLISYALPLPRGCAALIQLVPYAGEHSARNEIQYLADFVYLTYTGSLRDWHEFMGLAGWLPAFFQSASMDFSHEEYFRFKGALFEFRVPSDVLKISEKTWLSAALKFVRRGSAIQQQITGLNLKPGRDRENTLIVRRLPRPDVKLGEEWAERWRQLFEREPPYDQGIRRQGSLAAVNAYLPQPSPAATVFYHVQLIVDVDLPEKELRKKLDMATRGLHVLEQ